MVDHNNLWAKLSRRGVSPGFINILIDLYNKASLSIVTSQGKTPPVSVTKGVLQGDPTSPELFSLLLADLESFLSSRGVSGVSILHQHEFNVLAFADDLVILADSAPQPQQETEASQ